MELRQRALEVLCFCDPVEKATAVMQMHEQVEGFTLAVSSVLTADGLDLPGRPVKPDLLHYSSVARRAPSTLQGRKVLMHAIAHIEFNAINLALDAVWRFQDMPSKYYLDWLQVAGEEGRHFLMVRDWLLTYGCDYGDFAAHQGLWSMCEKTQQDITARMALVPRTLEARGLDATPLIQAKLKQVGTDDARAAVDILDTILREEVGHVAIGNDWYRFLCSKAQVNPESYYVELVAKYEAPRMRPPFNIAARKAAGFTEQEIAWLEQH